MLIQLQMVSDGRIVRRVLGGRRDDFGVLVRRYYGAVQSVARARLENPADVEDVAQEAFINAWRRLDTLATPNRFGPWLMSIARNAAVSWGRRRREVLVPDAVDLPQEGVEPRAERDELQRIVWAKLLEMEPEQREILMLHYYGGKSLGEVALLLEISRAAAGKRLQRARAALGNEFLKAVGERPQPQTRKAAWKGVMAAVAGAPVAWQSKAAAAGSASMVLVKVLLAGLAVVAIGAGTNVAVKYARSERTSERETAVTPAKEVAQSAPPESEPTTATGSVPTEEAAPELHGPGKIDSFLLNNLAGGPVGDAEVRAELVTWGPHEMPPEAPFKKTAMADSAGHFVIENLPLGTYCVTARLPDLFGGDDYTVGAAETTGPRRIWMRPRISVKGQLLRADGSPVAGAVIYPIMHILFGDEEFPHVSVASLRAMTSADGSFEFPYCFPGGWKFYIMGEGVSPTITDFKTLEGDLLLQLEEPGSIRGRLIDAGNSQPKPGVTVQACMGKEVIVGNPSGASARKRGYRVTVEAASGADGTFRVSNLAPGKYKVLIGDVALLNTSPDTEYEVTPGSETPAEVRVATGASILGRVYDRATGEGVAGVAVIGAATIDPNAPAPVTSADGEYLIAGVKAGNHRLMVAAPLSDGVYEPIDVSSTAALVEYGQVLEGADIAISPIRPVTGMVLDTEGRPVAAAMVQCYDERRRRIATDDTGRYTFYNMTSSGKVTVFAQKDGRYSDFVTVEEVTGDIDLTLNIEGHGAVYGAAFGVDGKPLAVYYARAIRVDGATGESGHFWTASEYTLPTGEFALENLPAGTYDLVIEKGREAIRKRVTLGNGQVLRNLRLQCQAEGRLTISGRIVASDRGALLAPVARVEGGENVPARPDGLFTIKGLAEGTYDVVVWAAGYSPAVLQGVAAGSINLRLTLYPPASVSGRVTDASTGQPVGGFHLQCSAKPWVQVEKIRTSFSQSYSNTTGEFSFDNFAAFPVVLQVAAAGYAPFERQLTLEPGKVNQIDVKLQPGVVVVGTVVDTAGNPLPDVAVGWSLENQMARTDEQGAFKIENLADGAMKTLVAWCREYALACVEVTPRRGQETVVAFVLQPAGSLEVRASFNGQPVELNVRPTDLCYAGCFSTPDMQTWNGTRLPPGEMELTVEGYKIGQPFMSRTVVATVVAGQVTPVEVPF